MFDQVQTFSSKIIQMCDALTTLSHAQRLNCSTDKACKGGKKQSITSGISFVGSDCVSTAVKGLGQFFALIFLREISFTSKYKHEQRYM